MKAKYWNVIVLLFVVASAGAQEFDAEKYVPPYTLPAPEGCGIERFAIPIDFAPSIPYKGVEDIRFTPGWGDAKSDQYWSYAFLWYLEGKPAITAESIGKNLTAYYTGLIGRNIDRRKIPNDKLFPVKVSMTKASVDNGPVMFYGTIDMLDYMEQKPITLNCIVTVASCSVKDHTFVFHQISPKPRTDKVWKEFEKVWNGFDCEQKN